MRKEIMEYNYDWSLHSLFSAGSKGADSSPKEMAKLLQRLPSMKELLHPVFGMGEPGIKFMNIFSKYMEMILTAHDKGQKLAFTTFCHSPAIFYAMDIVPIVLEPMTVAGTLVGKGGMNEFMDFCVEAGFTETSCSSQRGALGAYLAGLAEKPDMVVIDTPGICDTNANSFSFASSYLDIPFFQLNYPPTLNDERAMLYHREDYKGMISFLEERTGNKLDPERLRQVMLEMEKQDELICEIQELQRLIPCPLPALFNLFLYAGRFIMGGLPECTDLLSSMLKKVKENAEAGISGLDSGTEKSRGFFIYIDHYAANIPLWRFLDNRGIAHLGSILDRFYQEEAFYAKDGEGYRLNTTDLDSMIDSLAVQNSRLPMVKQIRGPYDSPNMWRDEIISMAEALSADFCVYSGTPGCRNTWGMVKLMAADLEKAGLPTHIINADAFDERVEGWEATHHRFEEFLELRRLC